MTDDVAFLQAIAESPDELGPRLRYADFLDDKRDANSTTRAEFIRVQCALDHLAANDPEFAKLGQREQTLLGANWHVWMRPICQALGEPLPVPALKRTWGEWMHRRFRKRDLGNAPKIDLYWTGDSRPNHIVRPYGPVDRFLGYAQFVRGFVGKIALNATTGRSPTSLERLFERAPISHLILNDEVGSLLSFLVRKNLVRGLRSLELVCPNETAFRELINSPDAAGIRSFDLFMPTDEMFDPCRQLAGARTLQPERLGLHDISFDEESVIILAAAPIMAKVCRLTIELLSVTEQLLIRFLEGSRIEHLELVGPTGIRIERLTASRLRERFPGLTIVARGHANQ